MAITFELPPQVDDRLRKRFGDLDAMAKLGLAIEAYRAAELSLGQFADLLGIGHYEADGLLKQRRVMLEFSSEELAAARAAVERLLGQ
ncbi:hypothetical protein Pla175_12050 [Pirellulimonas nuda]|uniref:Uncharacterized protein n=1 Tax=Pirellulimonas nuda TaxID=2528009 RepID=A0A518D8N5_9BACT|nr:UPF0175 family protein [Pirellulimonas nuda]QDU87838.1 hypothetical protein Pla175_12050 [Pirellulimonas nuda]